MVEKRFSEALPSSEEMALFDKATIDGGLASFALMENAGLEMARIITNLFFKDKKKAQQITILCGSGNNGGDGLVLARHLLKITKKITLIAIAANRYSEDNIHNAKRFIKAGGKILLFGEQEYIEGIPIKRIDREICSELLAESHIIVDGILGIGQRSVPKGNARNLIELIKQVRSSESFLISLDIPSGINATSGEVFNPHLISDLTITIECIKRGMIQYPAREACGEIVTVQIGIDCSKGCEFSEIGSESLFNLTFRKPNCHKGTFGHLLIIGGSNNLPGAPILSAMAALRCGAGLVTVSRLTSFPQVNSWPEIMYSVIEDKHGFYREEYFESLRLLIEGVDALVLGPGLGQHLETGDFVRRVLSLAIDRELPTVLDADALNIIARSYSDEFAGKLVNCVATPHPGELSRLLGISVSEVQRDRYCSVKKMYDLYKCVSLIKGAATIAYNGKNGAVCLKGNPYMATPGSGDVLSGIIGTFLAHQTATYQAAISGVYLHALCGDFAILKGAAPIIASDIIAAIPEILRDLP